MATVNFSVPEPVKEAFNRAFAGENKSAIVAALMERAVAEKARLERRSAAVEEILALRRELPPSTDLAIARARRAGRP